MGDHAQLGHNGLKSHNRNTQGSKSCNCKLRDQNRTIIIYEGLSV